jgi:uncharacterized protein with PIN domain
MEGLPSILGSVMKVHHRQRVCGYTAGQGPQCRKPWWCGQHWAEGMEQQPHGFRLEGEQLKVS